MEACSHRWLVATHRCRKTAARTGARRRRRGSAGEANADMEALVNRTYGQGTRPNSNCRARVVLINGGMTRCGRSEQRRVTASGRPIGHVISAAHQHEEV